MDKVNKKLLEENGIIYNAVQKKYVCLLCQQTGRKSLEPQHLKMDKHVARLRSFKNVFIIIENKPFCKLCTLEIDWWDVPDHAIFHEIAPFWCAPDKNLSFYSNYLTRVKKTYYCHLCDQVLRFWSMAWNHLEDERHLKLRIKVESDDANVPPKHQWNEWISEGYTPSSKTQIECRMCEVKLDFSEVQEHTSSLTHKQQKLTFRKKIQERSNAEKSNETSKPPQKTQNSVAQMPREFPKRAMICNFFIEPDTLPSGAVLESKPVQSSNESRANNDISMDSSRIDLEPSWEKEILRRVKKRRSEFEFVVKRCSWVLRTSHPLFKQIFFSKNCKELNLDSPLESLYCLLCVENIPSSETTKNHVSSEKHVNSLKKYGSFCITMTGTKKYYCKCCYEPNKNLARFYRHLMTDRHVELASEFNRRKNDQLGIEQPEVTESSEIETNNTGDSQLLCKNLELLSTNPLSSTQDNSRHNNELNSEVSQNILQTDPAMSPRLEDKKTDENFELFDKHSNWVVGSKHPLYKSPKITNLEDELVDDSEHTYCVICCVQFDSLKTTKEHIVSIEHEKMFKKNGCHYIEMTREANYHCSCCKSTTKDFEEMYEHLMSNEHKRIVCQNNEIEGKQSVVVKSAENHGNETESNDCLSLPTAECSSSLETPLNSNGTAENLDWLNDDRVWMIECRHQKINKLALKNLDKNSSKDMNDQFFICRICPTGLLNAKDAKSHVSGKKHTKLLETYGCQYVKVLPNSRYLCTCCMRRKKSIDKMCDHVTSAMHVAKVGTGNSNLINAISTKKQESPVTVDPKNEVDDLKNFFVRDLDWVIDSVHALFPNRTVKPPHEKMSSNQGTDLYHCLVCFHDLPGAEITRRHISGESHRNSMKQYGCHLIQVAPNLNYRCNCCNEENTTFLNIHKHLVSSEHANMLIFHNKKIAEKSAAVAKNKPRDGISKDNRVGPEFWQSGSFSFDFPAPQENLTSNQERRQPPHNNLPVTSSGSNDWFSQNFPPINAAPLKQPAAAKKFENSKFLEKDLNWVVGSADPLFKRLNFTNQRAPPNGTIQKELFYCLVCFAHFSGVGSVKNHIVDKRHIVSMIQYGCYFIEFSQESNYVCVCCNLQKNKFCNVYRHILSEAHMDQLRKINPKTGELAAINFVEKKVSYAQCNNNETLLTFLWLRSKKKCICFLCKDRPIFVDRKKADNHMNSIQHKFALMRYGCDNIKIQKNRQIICVCCNCKISQLDEVAAHVRDKKHMSSLIEVKGGSEPRSKVVTKIKPNIMTIDDPHKFVESLNRDNNLRNYSEDFRKDMEIYNAVYRQLDNVKEPLVNSMILTMVEELIRFSWQLELNDQCTDIDENNSSNPNNRQFKRNRCSWKDVRCELCDETANNRTNLHSHMAKHYSEEIISIEYSRARNGGFLEESEVESLNDSFDWTDVVDCDSPNELTEPQNDRSVDQNTDSGTSSSPQEFADSLKLDFSSSGSDGKFEDCEDEGNDGILESDRELFLKYVIKTKSNCDNDFIYELKDKLNDLKMGLNMSTIIDDKTIYCLVCRVPVPNTLKDHYDHLWGLDHCDYLDSMENDAAEYADLPNQLSDLDLAREHMEEMSDDTVRCHLCKKDVKNEDELLRDHIHEDEHERACALSRSRASTLFETMKSSLKCNYYWIKHYSCFVCGIEKKSEISFVTHLHSKEHSKKQLEMPNVERKMLLDCCLSCGVLWYGYRSSHFHHVNEVGHQWLLNNRFYFMPDLPNFAKTLLEHPENYADQTIRHLDEIRAQEISKGNALVNDLQEIVRPTFPLATAYTFGSKVIGFDNEDNNINIFLDCRNVYNGKGMSNSIVLNFIDKVYECLSKNADCWDVLEVSTNCRTPVIRADHRPTGLACDISFDNGLEVEKSKLIGRIVDAYPTFRKLIVILKSWMLRCDLTGFERIADTSLHWLVIFYLQSESILPSIATLISTKNESKIIAGCEVGVSYDFGHCEPDEDSSVKNLLRRFFTFYAKFDFRFDVVCPLLGNPIKKIDFAHPENLPKEMNTYARRYVKKSKNSERIGMDSPMCIQDPFDLLNNFTRDVQKNALNRFLTCCSKSSDIMTSLDASQGH